MYVREKPLLMSAGMTYFNWKDFLVLHDGAEAQHAECKGAEHHSAKSQHVDPSWCQMYHRAELQRAKMPRGRCYKVQNKLIG
jgi:hypothetical protein